MNKIVLYKIIAISIGTLIGFILAETAYRIYHYNTFHNLEDIEIGDRDAVNTPDTEQKLGNVIQLASERKIVYEFIPNSTYKFKEVGVTTNNDGFRDKDYPDKKPGASTRIIGLGDSVMFGWGVEEEETFLTRLENNLNLDTSSNYEVINTAVPGYNTAMEVEVLRHKFDLDQVDLVILNFVINDFHMADFMRERPNYFSLRKSLVVRTIMNEKGFRLKNSPWFGDEVRYASFPEETPEGYKDLVGEEACYGSLDSLKDLAVQHNFKVIVVSHCPYFEPPESLKDLCEENGFEYVDVKPVWHEYQKSNTHAEWKLTKEDYHPSALAHEIIADVLTGVVKGDQIRSID